MLGCRQEVSIRIQRKKDVFYFECEVAAHFARQSPHCGNNLPMQYRRTPFQFSVLARVVRNSGIFSHSMNLGILLGSSWLETN
jgi:hypothetical protein